MSTSFDFGNQIDCVQLIPPQAWDGNADVTSAIVSTDGCEGIAVVVNTGATTDGVDLGVAFHEGDADDFTPASGNLIPSARILREPAVDGDADNVAYTFSIKANARYIAIVVSRAGTVAAAISATAIKGMLAEVPAT